MKLYNLYKSLILENVGNTIDQLVKGETTKDGLFTVDVAECLAACGGAPAVLVGDDEYHQNMTVEKLDKLIDQLSNKE